MNNLKFYRKGTKVVICPAGQEKPLIEVTIVEKAQGRGDSKSLVKVCATHPLDIFGDKHKVIGGTEIQQSDITWLNPADWQVRAKIEKAKG